MGISSLQVERMGFRYFDDDEEEEEDDCGNANNDDCDDNDTWSGEYTRTTWTTVSLT